MILFTTRTCPKCEVVKKHISDWSNVTVMDIGTPDGMAEYIMNDIRSREVPVLVDADIVQIGAQPIIEYLKKKGIAK
ncbi:MAG: hypothetical protein A4E32_01777 [Methanomassiliicoccales archaeon PtaU1.Bin124]|nr:MAG: hypothetical protein A4E32_01777 [Methanomassiliicoccales archaeon PtaU1.Bin124]